MSETSYKYRDTLAAIGRLAEQAVKDTGAGPKNEAEHVHTEVGHAAVQPSCFIKSLPPRLLTKAAEVATAINPQNAPVLGAMAGVTGIPLDPMHLTVLTTKYWGSQPRKLTVSFMEPTPADLQARILQHMSAWSSRCCVSFEVTSGTGNVRISRGAGGYWSYLGTDIRLIPPNRPTMNLEGFTMATPEAEYKRVVRHETGHTLGFPHEHMRRALVERIDPEKAYEYFSRRYGWSKSMVDQQVLTPLSQGTFMGTPADQDSIMCYQLPGEITKDGLPIHGGLDINETDYRFASEIYPPVGSALLGMTVEEWDESEDVADPKLT